MKKTILLLLFAGSLFSCSDDDNGTTVNAGLNGSWTMTEFLAFMETLPEIGTNEIIWEIDLEAEELIVTNTIEDEYPYILESGTYEIRVTGERFIIEQGEYDPEYDYHFDGDILVLDSNIDGMVDGPVMHFNTAQQR